MRASASRHFGSLSSSEVAHGKESTGVCACGSIVGPIFGGSSVCAEPPHAPSKEITRTPNPLCTNRFTFVPFSFVGLEVSEAGNTESASVEDSNAYAKEVQQCACHVVRCAKRSPPVPIQLQFLRLERRLCVIMVTIETKSKFTSSHQPGPKSPIRCA